MSKKSLIWKIPCTVLGVVLGIVLILLIAITVVLTTPSARIGLALRSRSSDDEEEAEDTTSTPMSFELPDGEIRNFHLLLNPMDLGVGIHAPYQTYRYTTDFTPDLNSPINTYFNMPSVLDALRLNFGIGYPF